MSSHCHQIRAGQLTATEIPAAGLLVLTSKSSSKVRLIARPGVEDADWASFTLPAIAQIAQVLTPWATWYCSPDATDGTDIEKTTHGMAYWTRDAIWIRSSRHPDDAIPSALHEAFHSAEHWLTGDEIEVLRAASAGGPDMPRITDYNIYWCRGDEVRARAFAAFAYAHWLMGTVPDYRWRMPKHERLWTMIVRGDLGLRVAARGHIPANRMPEILRQRLAQRSDTRKVIDAVRNGLVGAWDWCTGGVNRTTSAVAQSARSN
jgi:hypothetical protein